GTAARRLEMSRFGPGSVFIERRCPFCLSSTCHRPVVGMASACRRPVVALSSVVDKSSSRVRGSIPSPATDGSDPALASSCLRRVVPARVFDGSYLPGPQGGTTGRMLRVTTQPATQAADQATDQADQAAAQAQAGRPARDVAKVLRSRIAEELGVGERQVAAAIELLDGGATVPFIARYRKEATGALDDAQLRTLEERLRYLRELEERRSAILDSIREQGKLTDELEARILAADSKARLEDIYLPYKPKRRTKAQIAK